MEFDHIIEGVFFKKNISRALKQFLLREFDILF